MAKAEADDSTLKRRARRRLIGAIALVFLAVIILPMVFDAEKKQLDADISIQIPNQDAVVTKGIGSPGSAGTDAASGAAPAPPAAAAGDKAAPNGAEKKVSEKGDGEQRPADAPPAAAKAAAKPEFKSEPKAETTTSGKVEDKSAVKSETKRSAQDLAEEKRAAAILNAKDATAKAEKAMAPAAGAYVVQIGAFVTDEKVQEARDKLSAAGIKTYTEKLDTKDGERTRVRAGPFATKDAADEARDKIKGLGFAGAQAVAR